MSDTATSQPRQSSELFLLDTPLKHAGAIITSCMGEFTAPAQQEIVMLRAGGAIELHRIVESTSSEDSDDEDEKRTWLKLITRVETRSILRSMATVRLSGEKRDIVVLGSDSGCVSIIDLLGGKSKVLHCPIFGKTGCRRGTPGQYLSSDPKGRAIMISALEKRKLVYVLNKDSTGRPTIASPLEAHRSRTIVLDTVGVDNGYDNPIFASLEFQYPDTDDDLTEASPLASPEKQLAYYELDLGLNHVSRRWTTTVHCSACCLVALQGGTDGPSGVLVGGEDWIEYLHEDMTLSSDGETSKIICPIPRRKLHPSGKGVLVTKMTVHRQKVHKKDKWNFFALAQSEFGDLYKVTIRLVPGDKTKVIGITVSLVDTLPVANALNVNKRGMLFVSSEFGDHALYQFVQIDVEGKAPTCTSEESAQAFSNQKLSLNGISNDIAYFDKTDYASKIACTFTPSLLQNLRRIYSIDSLAPTTGVLVGELAGNEVSPQIYTLNGRGPRSSLRILRHGTAVTELAVSDLPGVPGAVYTIRDNSKEAQEKKDEVDKYIIVSFADATLVLSVGETVEEVGEGSPFVTDSPTLACSALANGGIVQVTPNVIRIIDLKEGKPAVQWVCPGLKRIECASANESQVIIAFAGGDLIYFELDPVSGNFEEKPSKNFDADVSCLDVGTIQEGRSRSMFAVIGFRDSTVRVVSLEPGKLLVQRNLKTLSARPHSVALQYMNMHEQAETGSREDVILTVGLDDGSSVRSGVDPVTGSISDSPTRRFLGVRPVSVCRISINSSPATLLLSSRPWISRLDPKSGKYYMAPLSYAPLDHGCAFKNESIKEGIVVTAGKTLRILSVDSEGSGLGTDDEAFNSKKVDLRYTPRQMCLLTAGGVASHSQQQDARKLFLAIVESDYNEYGLDDKRALGFDLSSGSGKKSEMKKNGDTDGDGDGMDTDSDEEDEEKKEDEDNEEDEDEDIEARSTPIRGPYPASPGHWGSCIRLVDPSNGCSTLDCVEMGKNEAALCCASVRFHSRGGEALLAVGTVTGMTLHPLNQISSHVVLYRVVNGERLQLLHRTKVDEGPVLALAHFQGRLLVGIGRTLRLYEMGQKKVLKKCELRGLPTMVKTLQAAGDKVYVGDMLQSMQFVRYDSSANRLILVANDRTPRPVTCQELLDMSTVAVGDKFGNISILRLPRGADAGAIDVSGTRALWDSSRDDLAPKFNMLCNYYVGEVVTGMTRASLVAGGAESLIYVTITGRIGALVPFTSRDDIDFYTQLEGYLRTDAPRPTGREPQSYRSYYGPVKHIIDGDLCSMFGHLSYEEQKKIAERLDSTVGQISKKLEDTRNALL